MNRQIIQLFAVFVGLFALLVIFTSRWTVFEAESLEENSANRRPLLEEQQVPRGQIFARDGRTVIARSVKQGTGQRTRYVREYPLGNVFSHPIGYSFVEYGRAGLEREHNEQLAGERSEFESSAAAAVTTFIVEPGGKRACVARLRKFGRLSRSGTVLGS